MKLPEIDSRDELPSVFNELGLLGNGVEIGVSQGVFSSHIRQNWKGEMLYLVDRWIHVPEWDDSANVSPEKNEEFYYGVCRMFHPFRNVQILRMDSLQAAAQFEDGFFDWIYIDADHHYEAVKADLNSWYPKLKNNGIIAGHDYLDGMFWGSLFGVKSAVDEWAKINGLEVFIAPNPHHVPTWYCCKC
jgi:hypothetical protein